MTPQAIVQTPQMFRRGIHGHPWPWNKKIVARTKPFSANLNTIGPQRNSPGFGSFGPDVEPSDLWKPPATVIPQISTGNACRSGFKNGSHSWHSHRR